MIIGPGWVMLLSVVYVVFLGRAPCTKDPQVLGRHSLVSELRYVIT